MFHRLNTNIFLRQHQFFEKYSENSYIYNNGKNFQRNENEDSDKSQEYELVFRIYQNVFTLDSCNTEWFGKWLGQQKLSRKRLQEKWWMSETRPFWCVEEVSSSLSIVLMKQFKDLKNTHNKVKRSCQKLQQKKLKVKQIYRNYKIEKMKIRENSTIWGTERDSFIRLQQKILVITGAETRIYYYCYY